MIDVLRICTVPISKTLMIKQQCSLSPQVIYIYIYICIPDPGVSCICKHVLYNEHNLGSPVYIYIVVKNLLTNAGDLWVRKIPWRNGWQTTPVFLPGQSHEQGSLEGYSP